MDIDIHNVKSIEIKEIKEHTLDNRKFFVRKIIIRSKEGKQELTLYSDFKETLKV